MRASSHRVSDQAGVDRLTGVVAAAIVWGVAVGTRVGAGGQLPDTFFGEMSPPTIAYETQQPHDPIAQLNEKLADGSAALTYEQGSGYLRSVLNAVGAPVESQLPVFSKTSVQAGIIGPANPRTLFFNDDLVVGWPRGGFIEAAAVDPKLGVIFYNLEQQPSSAPRFIRGRGCTSCHVSVEGTLGVPGLLLRSEAALTDGRTMRQLGSELVDHRLPLSKRWGGWYVTGRNIGVASLGNLMLRDLADEELLATPKAIPVTTLEGKFDLSGYLSPYSDIAALMTFDHQIHMINLLARLSWEARAAEGQADAATRIDAVAHEVVDYMLFVEEAPITGPVQGSSGFAERFSARGPMDSHGRSLRQLDLTQRLLRYPCSYMIYSEAFDGLPPAARDAVYRRMYAVLADQDQSPRYSRLTAADRRAIVEILRETKTGLPDYFR